MVVCLCLNQVRCKQYVGARHESIICPGCGCLCDDLDVTVDGDRIVEVSNVCLWGVSRFFHAKKFHPKKERHRLLAPQNSTVSASSRMTSRGAQARPCSWMLW